MVKARKLLIITICIALLIALASWKFLFPEKLTVKTAEAALRDLSQTISYAGAIDSTLRVKIGSEMAGRVAAVHFNELDDVREGQVLIKLEDAEVTAQLNQAQEALNQAQINLVNVESNLTRVRELFKKGFASQEQLEASQQAVDVGRAMVKQNRANYELATARLNNSTITAPASGTIVSKNVAVGEIVAGPLGGATFSAPTFMAEIADLGDLEVIVDVDEVDIGKIQVGQQAAISVDAFPEKSYQGVVKEIAFMTSSRREVGITYRVKARITNPDRALKLGMTANLDFLLGKKEQVLTVPKSAVITEGDTQFVF
ncbi:MAG: transporter, partial [Deltaproteobacteria bacterium]|nr:transporter [Deltaproteobacteria bacterium]